MASYIQILDSFGLWGIIIMAYLVLGTSLLISSKNKYLGLPILISTILFTLVLTAFLIALNGPH